MLRIGQFSKLAKISIKTLRYYDKIGLLKPAMIDAATSYRYYTEEQLHTVCLITAYKAAGLSNDSISSLLRGGLDERTALVHQRELLLRQIEELERSVACLEGLLDGAGRQSYEATVKRVPRRLVFCCRGYVANAEGIHDFIRASMQEFKKSNPDIDFSEPDYCCVIYPDDGYREDNIFIEYAQSVERAGCDTATVKFRETEEICAVSVLHRGGYDSLRNAYLYAVNWAKENGYELAGEPRERYIAGAWNRSEVSDWLTELQLPVKVN